MTNSEYEGLSITVFDYVCENKYLSFGEKFMLGLIFGLSIKNGFCFAKNDYFAKRLGTTENSIKMFLVRLKSKGLISITESSKKKRERKITLPNLEKFSQYTKKTMDSIAPEVDPEPLHVNIDETPNYDKFVPQKKAPKTVNIVNVGQIVLSERMRRFASDKGYNEVQTEEVFEHFLNHHLSKGNTFKDWDRAFNTWIINQKSFKKNFSDAPARNTSNSSSSMVGQRIMMENMLLSEHPAIERIMMRRNIHISNVMMGFTPIPEDLSCYALTEIRTPKEGVQMIWYDTKKYAKQNDDIITVDAIEYKG